jgi:hypothetical protein
MSAAAFGQVVYEPARYQYGEYGEVFYGGRNPAFTGNAYVYLPPALQVPYSAQRSSTPVYVNGYTPMGPGTGFVSPYSQDSAVSAPQYVPYVFTDYLPFVEAGQFGFTVDQARNEAYANVPRIQGGYAPRPGETMGTVRVEGEAGAPMGQQSTAAPASDPKAKAIPLINWAKNEKTKNPALYKALVTEARKYDPAAVDAMERSMASEK